MSSSFFTPITGSVQPRFASVASLMRLPQLALDDVRFGQVDVGAGRRRARTPITTLIPWSYFLLQPYGPALHHWIQFSLSK